MRVLILGGNGFIGFEVCRELLSRGHEVTALARLPEKFARRLPGVSWLKGDRRAMQSRNAWRPLEGFGAVVNCAGALQSGAGDDVDAVQHGAMLALYEAAATAKVGLIVQVSARTDGPGAGQAFLSSKRRADDALERSGVPFVILRPAIVVGRNAYGGSALLRALAAFPCRTPLVHADAPMQFVALDDVAEAVADSLEGRVEAGTDLVLAGPEFLSLRETVAIHRAWLGLPPARAINVPAAMAWPATALADLLGRLGWRSPLRSTAMEIAAGGVAAASTDRRQPDGQKRDGLGAILAKNPAGAQDLWFARLYLLKPVVFGVLSLFWILSGSIALMRLDQSARLLEAVTPAPVIANLLAVATSLADIVL
ncbi:MAG: NAD(P)H-binding protein, partial [Rhizobiaceae bacterium]|nr:NAD(P)H-binding protein [Rhizobiaceae bacterium]